MWSSDAQRAAVVVSLVAILGACGFRPLHQEPKEGTGNALKNIRIDPIANRAGQILRNELLSRITPSGTPKTPLYALGVTFSESTRNLAIRKDEVATRANMTLSAQFKLVSAVDEKKIMTSGIAQSIVSFNILRNDFATISSQNNARERGIKQLAREIQTRLAIYLSRHARAETSP